MNITITTRKQHPVSDEVLYALVQDSYNQWREVGLWASWMDYTLEDFSRAIYNAVVFLAIDTDSNELLGMHCFSCYPHKHYATGYYLAISSKMKHRGIATRLLALEVSKFREKGYLYLRGVSAASATWSVQWHKKEGYRVIGISCPANRNHSVYSFHLQLASASLRHPSTLLWNKPLAPITASLRLFVTRILVAFR